MTYRVWNLTITAFVYYCLQLLPRRIDNAIDSVAVSLRVLRVLCFAVGGQCDAARLS